MRKPKERTCKTCGLALPKRVRPRHEHCSTCRKVASGRKPSASMWGNEDLMWKSINNRGARIKALESGAA